MTKRMLIDASHAEETRVVVLDGSRLEDYDVETATRRQLKGNIYLAKVVRVEPSLQAAFVEYGGNRHGFLAFGEIHPDYYQIPVADRQRLLDMQEAEAREEEEAEEREVVAERGGAAPGHAESAIADQSADDDGADAGRIDIATFEVGLQGGDDYGQPPRQEPPEEEQGSPMPIGDAAEQAAQESLPGDDGPSPRTQAALMAQDVVTGEILPASDHPPADGDAGVAPTDMGADLGTDLAPEAVEPLPAAEEPAGERPAQEHWAQETDAPALPPETIGGEAEERAERRPPPRFMRNYKIQEVIRRRQILLIQVVKEERGTKGAALTTYISLAGRFSVLMPNSPRGGGISRKITSAADRKRLREVVTELAMPRGMGLIVRTAGANRPKPEIKRDCEYLLRLWDDIRERTMASTAPALIYEEANLIKRTIRDVYSRDVDEVVVDGEEAWRAAREFMRMLMPSHARKVMLWKEGGQPLFARNQVDAQLDAMLSPTVQLRSGGYLVINQTEALVAIDVNSGRATRERGIEETALRTNLEAADEVARQLRLRDLAGLIVIDFIDMEAKKHNAMVERRIKEALKNDRARIQVGHISHFGLLEMSRQRLRPSLAETSFVACPHCGGTGHVRSTESAALHVLRGIEEEGAKRRSAEIVVHVAAGSALYILNHKRERLTEIEARYAMRVSFAADDTLLPSEFRIEKLRAQTADALPPAIRPDTPALTAPGPIAPEPMDDEAEEEEEPDVAAEGEPEAEIEAAPAAASGPEAAHPNGDARPGETAEEGERRRRRRRRRRRGGRREEETTGDFGSGPQPGLPELADGIAPGAAAPELIAEQSAAAAPAGGPAAPEEAGEDGRFRRRGQRGGRRRRRDESGPQPAQSHGVPQDAPDEAPHPVPYAGPTPADPFGGHAFDIFDVMDQAERGASPQSPAMPAAMDMSPAAGPVAPGPLPAEIAPPVLIDPTPAIDIPPPPEPAAVAATPDAVTSEPEPEPPPAVQPVVIATAPPEGERKRGWWRR